MWKQLNLMKIPVAASTDVLLASFKISYLIDKNKKAQTTGRTLLLLAAIKMCKVMHGENYSQALKATLFLLIPSCYKLNQCQKISRNAC
jgi:hypothetical protein